ncbi:MAG: coproporphyrinogen dehydrogenase HemZ [Lachnospiraceae bacterium]|nr:coproporphyrinogen dehydrogenase HemZ [Lachnospiraceae bacterium]
MIVVKINEAQFEYDIHSLIKAFYPGAEVKVLGWDTEVQSEEGMPEFEIEFQRNGISFCIKEKENSVEGYTVYKKPDDRAEVKNDLKLLIYEKLSEFLQKELPWGTLTGIRPTKIPMTLLSETDSAYDEEGILKFMQEKYAVSEEKGRLSIEIAKREQALLSKLHYKDGYSLYIGIPFCPTTCLYCSFTSFPIGAWKDKVDGYLTALEKETDAAVKMMDGKILDTVYIGGGTPTTLSETELDRLLTKLKTVFDFSTVQEFTVEAGRADSITREKLQVLLEHGVTRISVNPQTMREETLKLIGRRATAAQTVEVYKLAREIGFSNINMDIILGLPGEGVADVAYTIEEIRKLAPDSLTVHSLAVKRASKLSQWIQENGMELLHNTEETMEIAAKGAKNMGMVPYYLYRQKNMSGNFENVGYAAEGKFGIYNILMMEEVQSIVALGAGSISKRLFDGGRIERCENVKEVSQYIERIDEMIERKKVLFGDC